MRLLGALGSWGAARSIGAPKVWEEQMNELSEFPVLGGIQTGPE